MNRRQRRKQFKRIYGMNSEQYAKWVREHWPEIMATRLREELEEGAKIIHKSIDAWKEEIRAAVESKKGEKKDGKDGIDP